MTIEEIADQFADLTDNRSRRFDEMAGAVFAYQRTANRVYSRYCKSVSQDGEHLEDPPFLPVDAFKHAAVTTFDPADAKACFTSSATGHGTRSKHYVRDLSLYERSVSRGFEHAFGEGTWRIVAHLPAYAESSSLVYMLRHLIDEHGAPGSGFFLEDTEVLTRAIDATRMDGVRLMVFGAAFGLLDLLRDARYELPADSVVVETGGMKTHRREISRSLLHEKLANGFGLGRASIRSEYGMCELMSQAYTRGDEIFAPPPWMRFTVVDLVDPSRPAESGRPGALAVTDLANIYSCSFLLTGDRAVRRGEGVEILGRMTDAELRGCNFLLENA